MAEITIELDDDVLLKLFMRAHECDVTLNAYVAGLISDAYGLPTSGGMSSGSARDDIEFGMPCERYSGPTIPFLEQDLADNETTSRAFYAENAEVLSKLGFNAPEPPPVVEPEPEPDPVADEESRLAALKGEIKGLLEELSLGDEDEARAALEQLRRAAGIDTPLEVVEEKMRQKAEEEAVTQEFLRLRNILDDVDYAYGRLKRHVKDSPDDKEAKSKFEVIKKNYSEVAGEIRSALMLREAELVWKKARKEEKIDRREAAFSPKVRNEFVEGLVEQIAKNPWCLDTTQRQAERMADEMTLVHPDGASEEETELRRDATDQLMDIYGEASVEDVDRYISEHYVHHLGGWHPRSSETEDIQEAAPEVTSLQASFHERPDGFQVSVGDLISHRLYPERTVEVTSIYVCRDGTVRYFGRRLVTDEPTSIWAVDAIRPGG